MQNNDSQPLEADTFIDPADTVEEVVPPEETASPPPPASHSDSAEANEKQVRMFLVLTIHRIFKNLGLKKCLRDYSMALHIHRLVEPSFLKISLSNDRLPQVNMYTAVAKSVAKEFKRTFRGKVKDMLLFPESTVEDIISDCIVKHTHIEVARETIDWGRCCKVITLLSVGAIITTVIVAWVCLLFVT